MKAINHPYAQSKVNEIDLIRRIVRQNILDAQQKQQTRHNQKHNVKLQFEPGDLVKIKRILPQSGLTTKLLQTHFGPFTILRNSLL